MSFSDAAVRALVDAIASHASQLGLFESVLTHEPKEAPGNGLHCSIWADAIDPLPGTSGLAATSCRISFHIRVYYNMLAEPQDVIDQDVLSAACALMAAYSGAFPLAGTIRNVDLLGEFGEPMKAQAGYLSQDRRFYRVMVVTLPLIENDWFGQVA